MRLFQKEDTIIGVNEKFIYLVEVYACWKMGFAMQNEYWVSCNRELKVTQKLLTTRKKNSKVWIQRHITLKYAPEKYLRNHGYREI